jgi:RNA-directed DNA polymerase
MRQDGWLGDGGKRQVKRTGNLLDQVASYHNLISAFYQAMKGCGKTREVCEFFYNLEEEIFHLQDALQNNSYRPGRYRFFTIHDPKERIIAVAPFKDRVVHHGLVNVLEKIFEPVFIYDSYATRKEKGTHKAILRAQKFVGTWSWYLKMDIEKYFDNVDHTSILSLLGRKIKDQLLIALLERVIGNTPVNGKGLPIGNLTSQFLANVYLDPLDHFIKEQMRIKGYVRYMDDFIVFGRSKKSLLEQKETIRQFLYHDLKLSFHEKATFINRSNHGLSFLGMRIFPTIIRLKPANRRRSLKKVEQRIKAWKNGLINDENMVQSIVSIIGHLRYFCPELNISLETPA